MRMQRTHQPTLPTAGMHSQQQKLAHTIPKLHPPTCAAALEPDLVRLGGVAGAALVALPRRLHKAVGAAQEVHAAAHVAALRDVACIHVESGGQHRHACMTGGTQCCAIPSPMQAFAGWLVELPCTVTAMLSPAQLY
jgi:hypothetical protein